MEYGFATLEVKAEGDDGRIEGYGSVFNSRDQGGDIVAPGAFRDSLAAMNAGGRSVKMLFQHDAARPIGVWDAVAEDERGLRVKGRFLTSVAAGREAWELVKAGALDGLSIGYRTLDADYTDAARVITKAELWEVSLVTFPMNEAARIDAVKAASMTERDMERLLTQDAGLSRSVARALMGGGFKAVTTTRDAGAGLSELAAHMRRSLEASR